MMPMEPGTWDMPAGQTPDSSLGEMLSVGGAQLPIAEIANAIVERSFELGLTWRLVPATVALPDTDGLLQVTVDGDSEPLPATSMIGGLGEGTRVFMILSPPAGVHVVGFMGYQLPAAIPGDAIGRPQLVILGADFSTPASSITSVNVPGMAFPVSAGAQYLVRLRASVGGAVAADAKLSWSGPAGAVMDRYVIAIPPADAVSQGAATFTSIRRGLATEQVTAITANTADGTIPGTGSNAFPGHWEDNLLTVGSVGGTMQLRIGQVVSNATPSILRLNSYIEVQRYR